MTAVIGPYVEFIYCACGCKKTLSKHPFRTDTGKYRMNRINKFINRHHFKVMERTEEHKRKIGLANKGNKRDDIIGEKNPLWKGDDVGYYALHDYVARYHPKSEHPICMLCKEKPSEQLACITGIYNREWRNWAWLCITCHME